MSITKGKVITNLFWKFAERIGAQFVTFVVSIVLARLLTPEEYGTIALVTIFITLANVFVSSGFGNSLIQKKDADDLAFSSAFYLSIAISLVMYGIVFLSAPYVAVFYGIPELTLILRVLGIKIPIAGINSIQQAYVSKKLIFKKFFYATIGGTIISGGVGIWMAYQGYGVWALVGQYLTNTIIDTVVLWFTVKWRPKLLFSFKVVKELYSYGWKLLLSSLLDTGYTELKSLLIGKMYTTTDLAYYNKGRQFPALVVTNINTSISSVLFPTISELQDDANAVMRVTRRAIKTSSYIMWPMMIGLGAVAEPFIELLLTEQWLPCVPYLRIGCFTYGLWPIHTANLQAMKALGRSDLFLKIEIQKKIVGLVILMLAMRHGVLVIALSGVLASLSSCYINAKPNKTLLGYSYSMQMKDMLPSFILACIMGAIVYPIQFFVVNNLLCVICQAISGAVIYVVGSIIFKFESFNYILNMLTNKVKRKEV